MKKYLLTLLTLLVILAPNVKADSDSNLGVQGDKYVINFINATSGYNEFPDFKTKVDFFNLEYNRTIFLELYNSIMNLYNTNYKSAYPYYQLDYQYYSDTPAFYTLSLRLYSSIPSLVLSGSDIDISPLASASIGASYYLNDQTYTTPVFSTNGARSLVTMPGRNRFYDYMLTTNFNLKVTTSLENINTVEFLNFRDKGTLTLNIGDTIPQFYAYDKVFDKLDTSTTTTVNLDNYEYVILNLKDYNQKNAFNTNLKVKGSIGITPIYNFGQTAKDDIMGSKVQDRCNVKYNDYTDYRLSILKQDLQNNSFYVVKGCEVGSSFKFDNTIFDITYVDDNNKSDPIVSIGGKDYHVIPFDKLPSSANKNEKENYVPGESERFALLDKLDFLINNLNRVWDAFTSFMGFVGKMFSTLPDEFKAIAISSFTIGCTLMIFKIIKSLK